MDQALHIVEDVGQPDPGDGSDERAHAVLLLAKSCSTRERAFDFILLARRVASASADFRLFAVDPADKAVLVHEGLEAGMAWQARYDLPVTVPSRL